MKTLTLHDFNSMAVGELDTPAPGPGEVRLRVLLTGICGTDLHGFTGANGRRVPGQVMGHETVGIVDALGDGVDLPTGASATINPVVGCGHCPACSAGTQQYCPDKRVIGVDPTRPACFAEYVIASATNVVLLGDAAPRRYGALVEPLAVGYHAARRAGVSAQDAVLVLGGGPIGQAVALAARRLHARSVTVSEPNQARRQLCASLGVDVIDPTETSVAEQVGARIGGPAGVAIDAVGASGTLADALQATSLGGRVVLVGMAAPQLDLNAYAVSTGERAVIGSFSYTAGEFAETAEWVGTNPPELARLIAQEVPAEEAPAQFTALSAELSVPGKVLVRFSPDP